MGIEGKGRKGIKGNRETVHGTTQGYLPMQDIHACFHSDEPVYAMHTAVVHAEDVCIKST